MEIEVDEAEAVGALDVPGDRANSDCAIATQDEGDLLGEDGLDDARRGVVDDLDDLLEVLGERALAVRPPAPDLAIAVVRDRDGGVPEKLDEACMSQRHRRLLLTRCERSGAGRDADHSHLPPVVSRRRGTHS